MVQKCDSLIGMYRIAILKSSRNWKAPDIKRIIRPEPELDICSSMKPSQLTVIQYESKSEMQLKIFSPLSSVVCSCIGPYSDLIRLALYFNKISLSALSGSSRAPGSVTTPPVVLKRCLVN